MLAKKNHKNSGEKSAKKVGNMELEGTVYRDGKIWLIEVPSLNLMTQGKTKKDALNMIVDAAFGLVECYFESEIEDGFEITATDYGKNVFGLSATNNKILLALSLKRQREKSGSTVREAAARLSSASPNAYGQYERGKTSISLEKYDQLLQAVDPMRRSLLRIV